MSNKANGRKKHSEPRHDVFWIGSAMLAVLLIGFTTYYLNAVTVSRIQVNGALHAPAEIIADLSGAMVGDTLYGLDPDLIASRIALHPWVESVEITRWPTGALSIEVKERLPVVLSVSASGQPGFYVDRTGRLLPVDSLSRYDVPLIRGITKGNRPEAIRDSTTLELLAVLSSLPASVDGLLSDLIMQPGGELEAVTVPVNDGGPVRIRLGRGDLARKMQTLRAFWMQAVAGFPDKRFESIDLRFQGQVVTKEKIVIS